MIGHPRGPRGVDLKSNGTWKYSQANIFGLRVDCLSRLSINSVWGSSKSLKFLGKVGAIPAKVDRNFALKVCIARFLHFYYVYGVVPIGISLPILDYVLVFSTCFIFQYMEFYQYVAVFKLLHYGAVGK